MRRTLLTVSLGLVMVARAAAPAMAQDTRKSYDDRRVGIAFEAAAIASARDDSAFFNFTDYEHNALRMVRLRLMSEWRVATPISFVGEFRAENGDAIEIPALYLRWRPWSDRAVAIQAGRVPPLIGAFPRRAYGRSNVVIGWPLAYQYLVSLRPDALPATVDDLLRMRGRGWQPSFPIGSSTVRPGVSMINASHWDTGVQISAQVRGVSFAGAVTEGPPANPSVRDRTSGLGWSGRASFTLPAGIVIGASGATGNWIDRSVLDGLPAQSAGSQHVAGVEVEAGQGPWLIRGEFFYSGFTLPIASEPVHLGARAGFLEGRYRFAARWQAGVRAELLRFARIDGGPARGLTPWDADVDRIEGAVSYRLATSTEIKAAWQQNWRDGGRERTRGYAAIQLLYWY